MAECLPRICESICGNEQYVCKDGEFRLNTIATNGVARFYLEKRYISLSLAELQYLREMFHVVQNQQNVYILCLPDVTVALISANYVGTVPNAIRHIIINIFSKNSKTL